MCTVTVRCATRELLVLLAVGFTVHGTLLPAQNRPFGIGRPATESAIRRRDISVMPDGRGLPPGQGTVAEGRAVYAVQCAACHGVEGLRSARQTAAQYPALVGGFGTLTSQTPVTTIGSYWPYATTVWDYIHRAMPYSLPGTLTPSQVYAVTAYLLYLNHIVAETTSLDAGRLAAIRMPNRDGFVPDPRPDVRPPR